MGLLSVLSSASSWAVRALRCCGCCGTTARKFPVQSDDDLPSCDDLTAKKGSPPAEGLGVAAEPGVQFVTSGQMGGSGGTAFNDYSLRTVNVAQWPIQKIQVRVGTTFVKGITVVYSGGASPIPHGPSGGTLYEFPVPASDPIVAVEVCYSLFINSLTFVLRSGKRSAKYGISGGTLRSISGAGRPLAYIFGACDLLWLVSIGFGFQADVVPFICSSLYGGTGGDAFDDSPLVPDNYLLVPTAGITGITVYYSALGVNQIKVTYQGIPVQPDAHGGSSGTSQTFSLDVATEFIAQVNLRYSSTRVTAIQFVTNRGRASPFFGATSGTAESYPKSASLRKLMAIGGRSSSNLDAIKFYFGPEVAMTFSDFYFSLPSGGLTDTPFFIDTIGPLGNSTSIPQSQTTSHGWDYENSTTVSISASLAVGVSATAGMTTPFGLSGTVSATATGTVEISATRRDTVHYNDAFTTVIPPHTSVTADFYLYKKIGAKLPFTAKQYMVVPQPGDTSKTVYMGTVSGVWNGVFASHCIANWNTPVPIAGTSSSTEDEQN